MKKSEKLATEILEGKATWLGNQHPFDVYWDAQGRRVEVKTMNIKKSDIGHKHIHASIGGNWDKNDYYMLMVNVDGSFDHCYLIESSEISNRPKPSMSITIPRIWENFEFKHRLYAIKKEGIIHRV